MSDLRKLSSNEPHVRKNRARYSLILKEYRYFAEKISLEAGNIRKSSSKGTHYARFLLYLTVLYEEIFRESFGQLDSFTALKKIKRIENLSNFKAFNRSEHNFYSATINCFSAFLAENHAHEEIIADDRLNLKLIKDVEGKSALSSDENSELQEKKIVRPNKSIYKGINSYPRNLKVSQLAKERSNWSCELDSNHLSFITQENGKNFVEAHHLVPMAVQDYYDYTLDFTDNVTTLCPNCHRLVHYADYREREKAVIKLFDERKSTYERHGIDINLDLLLNFYGII